jgi:hypothetical protein
MVRRLACVIGIAFALGGCPGGVPPQHDGGPDAEIRIDARPVPDGAPGPDATTCFVAATGKTGICEDVAVCTGTTTAGLCPGAANIQCCTN